MKIIKLLFFVFVIALAAVVILLAQGRGDRGGNSLPAPGSPPPVVVK